MKFDEIQWVLEIFREAFEHRNVDLPCFLGWEALDAREIFVRRLMSRLVRENKDRPGAPLERHGGVAQVGRRPWPRCRRNEMK